MSGGAGGALGSPNVESKNRSRPMYLNLNSDLNYEGR